MSQGQRSGYALLPHFQVGFLHHTHREAFVQMLHLRRLLAALPVCKNALTASASSKHG